MTDILTGDQPVAVGLARLSSPVPDQILDQVLGTLPAERRERLQRFTVRADLERGALADVLAKGLLGDRLALPPQRVILLRNALGAPVVVNTRSDDRITRVSLAHSGCWVACSVSDRPTGVDVEFRRGLSTPALRGMFSENTVRNLLRIEEPHRNRRALRMWTAIEAYLKMLGLGLHVDPHEVGVAVQGSELVTVWTKEHASQRVHLFDVDRDHVLAVCRSGAPLRRSFQLICTTSNELFTTYLANTSPWQHPNETLGVSA